MKDSMTPQRLMLKGKLLTNVERVRRHIANDDRCGICKKDREYFPCPTGVASFGSPEFFKMDFSRPYYWFELSLIFMSAWTLEEEIGMLCFPLCAENYG
ncbi:hypothetical protein GQ457_11G030220 [Hibiscus cannabinus]